MAVNDGAEKTIRVQFDIPEALYDRALPFIKKKSAIGTFGHIAFESWVKRKESQEGKGMKADQRKIREEVKKMKEEGLI